MKILAIGVRFIGQGQMMSPVPRGVPQDSVDIGVNPLHQFWVLGIEYKRRWDVTDIETQ